MVFSEGVVKSTSPGGEGVGELALPNISLNIPYKRKETKRGKDNYPKAGPYLKGLLLHRI